MIKLSNSANTEDGFTIIELLIATTVVSVILLLSTIMITNIGNLYYKGISQSHSQDDVRAITDEIAQHLQLTDTSPRILAVPPGYQVGESDYCIGTTTYTYILGKQIASTITDPSDQVHHVLWRENGTAGCPAPVNLSSVTSPPNTGTELIAPRSRLTVFTISASSPYTLTVNIAFGELDQLCDSGTSGDCNSPVSSTRVWSPRVPLGKILCKGSKAVSGQQFCGTANLTTTVVQRLQ